MSEKPKELTLDDQTKKYIKYGVIGVGLLIVLIILITVIVPKLTGKTASTSSTPEPAASKTSAGGVGTSSVSTGPTTSTPTPAPSKTNAGSTGPTSSTPKPAPGKTSAGSTGPKSSTPTPSPGKTSAGGSTTPPANQSTPPSQQSTPPANQSSQPPSQQSTPPANQPPAISPTLVGDNCYLYVTGISNGLLQFSSDNPINGFTLGNYTDQGPKTNITANKPGIYEITCSGAVIGNGSSIICTLNNVNVRMYNVFAQSESRNGLAYMINWTQQCASYNNSSQPGFQIQLTNASLWDGLPLWVSIKYIGKVGDLDNCNLFASGIGSTGMLQLSNYSSYHPISGFTVADDNTSGPKTMIIPNKPGIYEIICSGAFIGKGNSIFAKLNNVNVRMYSVFAQSESKNGLAYMMNWTQQCVAYSDLTLSGFQIQLINATLWDGMPLWVSIKYISPINNNNIHIPKSLSVYYPGNCYLYATVMLTGGMLQFSNYSSNNRINGFTLGNNNGSGPDTVIIPNKPGMYEITCSGCVKGYGNSIFGTLDNVNVKKYNVFAQSESNNDDEYMMNWTVHARPYSDLTLAGFQIQLTNATLWSDIPLWVFVRYLGV